MDFHFQNKQITGVLSILPETEYRMEDEVIDPNDSKVKRLQKVIGYGSRRRVKGNTCMSDLLLYGLRHLISSQQLNPDDIGAIIVSTLCEDYLLPSLGCILQGELGLENDVYCMDTPQACAGYVTGLIHAFLLLDHMPNKKVIVCTGEILNRKSDPNEAKYEHPSFGGDIANITIVENCHSSRDIYANYFTDGSRRNALIIEDGGFRNPMTAEKLKMQTNNLPCMGVSMDGSGVFNFVQKEVPPSIFELSKQAGVTVDDIDWFLFHQPNKFMLQKLAGALGVPFRKVPMKLTETLGNSDSGTIPAIMTTEAADSLLSHNNLCCLSGFGGGLTWTSIIMDIGNLDFCECITSDL
ncbi:MAG: hypothetical protein IJ079_02110 [Lachnospiraceae bacterium]|nr:hypothetical protein [Lachnospiraceae bacterium]